MRRKQLLFSKREKAEKSTTMGEDNENTGGNLGIPNNNNQMSETNNDQTPQENKNTKNNDGQKKNRKGIK